MKKTTLLVIISTVLLCVNIGLILFIFIGKRPKHDHEGPRSIIIERLDFDETQIKRYDSMIEKHRREIRQTQDHIMELKNVLYGGLVIENDLRYRDSLIHEIATAQQSIERIHYKHFQDIQTLCISAHQKEEFKKLTKDIARLFSPKRPERKHP